jgi:hypothetical protein
MDTIIDDGKSDAFEGFVLLMRIFSGRPEHVAEIETWAAPATRVTCRWRTRYTRAV